MTISFGVPSPTKHVDVSGSTRWTTLGSSGAVTWSSPAEAEGIVSLAPNGKSCDITGNKAGVAKITATDEAGSVTDVILVGGLLAYGPDGALYGTYAKDWVPIWSASNIPTADFMKTNDYAFAFLPPTQWTDTSFNVTCYLISVQTMSKLVSTDTTSIMGSASDPPVSIQDSDLGNVNDTTPGTGLMGLYTNFGELDLNMVRRLDAEVNFSGSNGSWAPPGIRTNFSVRWTGYVKANEEGTTYLFQIVSIGGVRLWVNGKLAINRFSSHTIETNDSPYFAFRANQRILITMEYYYNNETGGATAQLQWATPSMASAGVIPEANLFPSFE